MPSVFISYARSTETAAEQVADALRSLGHQVWRDDELPAHRPYAEVIDERLRSADAVVVLWSAEAAKSQWVRAEADAARQMGTLIQASLDGTIPPLPFNQIQCADLSAWEGERDRSGWQKVEQSLAALAGSPVNDEKALAHSERLSICVLPFANMSGDSEQEYFSDGISEDITTDLSKVSALSVTARNTAFMFKGKAVDICQVARSLHVSHVLEGSVRKAGDRVRITAQLIDGATGDHLWGERYDRDLTDIFAIQDEISKAIVSALQLKLLPEERMAIEQRGTTSAEAYNFYLMARQYWVTGTHGDTRREEAVERICQRAIELDPAYARALALMALAQASLRFGFGIKGVDEGLTAAEQALSLDPTIAEAHCVIARHHSEAGRDAGADAEIAKALELDPDSWEVNMEAARLCMRHRRIPEATHHYEKAVEVMESDRHAWMMLITCYKALGNQAGVDRASKKLIEQAEKAIAVEPSDTAALASGVSALAAMGDYVRAREWMERALLLAPENYNMRYNFACTLATHLGDKEGALNILEQNFAKVTGMQVRMATTDPDLDPLRDDPRFQKMLAAAQKRLGIELPGKVNPAEAASPPRS